jgi:hypothetical protein
MRQKVGMAEKQRRHALPSVVPSPAIAASG